MRRQSDCRGCGHKPGAAGGCRRQEGPPHPPETAGGRPYQHLDLRLRASALGGDTFLPFPASPAWGPRA